MSDAILIVTPDSAQNATLQNSLQSDFVVYTASGSEDVLELALKHRPKVILMDMRLPSGSGLEVLAALRQYPRTAHIPFIFMVEGTDALMKPNYLQAGAHDVVEKPLDLAELGLRIKNGIGGFSAVPQLHPITHLLTEAGFQQAQAAIKPPYTLLNLRINEFEIFKDLNGFVTANEVLIFAATVLEEAVNLLGKPEDFIGHIQEAEFSVITTTPNTGMLRDYLDERLGEQLPQFHNFMERDQGYIELEDSTRKPLMTLEMELSQVS